jgi:hypothetical protein
VTDTEKSSKAAQLDPDPRTAYAALDGSFSFDDLGHVRASDRWTWRGEDELARFDRAARERAQLGDVVFAAGAIVRGVVITRPGESPRGFVVTLEGGTTR